MGTEVVVAVIALIAAIASGGIAFASQQTAHSAAKEVHVLQHQLDQHRTFQRYSLALTRAAFHFQARIYNIVMHEFLDAHYDSKHADEHEYAVHSTLFLFAEYFAWSEIIRREVHFLDAGDTELNRQFETRDFAIENTLDGDHFQDQRPFRVLRVEQRALGELMIAPRSVGASEGKRSEPIGYAAFCQRLADPAFAKWFDPLTESIRGFAATRSGVERLTALQDDLIDLINFLDPNRRAYPTDGRRRISQEPAT